MRDWLTDEEEKRERKGVALLRLETFLLAFGMIALVVFALRALLQG